MPVIMREKRGKRAKGEAVMEKYEIRLVRKDGGPVVYASTYMSDYAALRGARHMAGAEDSIEIWRGMDCIYRDHFRPASAH